MYITLTSIIVVVALAGLLGAALLLDLKTELRKYEQEAFNRGMRHFNSGYPLDGYERSGAYYRGYAHASTNAQEAQLR